MFRKRQKLIKLADKSDAGWLVVQEYEQEKLADDSEDEKRIKKAQEKAARKKKQLATLSKKPGFDSARGINTILLLAASTTASFFGVMRLFAFSLSFPKLVLRETS